MKKSIFVLAFLFVCFPLFCELPKVINESIENEEEFLKKKKQLLEEISESHFEESGESLLDIEAEKMRPIASGFLSDAPGSDDEGLIAATGSLDDISFLSGMPPINEEGLLAAAADRLGPTASGFLSDTPSPTDEDQIDPKVLRDFIESKGLIECRQKEGRLTIAADVRFRWAVASETVDGVKQRGQGTETALNLFKSEVSLFLDYLAPRSWVSTKVRWVNFDGRDGGTATRVEMERAFIGYDICSECDEDFYIEIGRSRLDFLFDSRVQFSSTFDGLHLYYTNCFKGVGTVVIHGGPFIIDSFSNHYGWIVEAFVNHFADTGFSMKYSLIDWYRHAPTFNFGAMKNAGTVTIVNNPRYRFLVSQMLFGYESKIDFAGCKTLFIYAAVLANHLAQASKTTAHKKLNRAWYAGFTLGKLCKACDWSLDINFQSVQAQAVPEFDMSGIGHGNAAGSFLSDAIILGDFPFNARGFTNFKGWQFNLLYALTDSLSLRAKAEWSTPRNASVGGDFFWKNFEMVVIYAF